MTQKRKVSCITGPRLSSGVLCLVFYDPMQFCIIYLDLGIISSEEHTLDKIKGGTTEWYNMIMSKINFKLYLASSFMNNV